MASSIAMPQMGLTMEAGTVLRWRKQVGDAVRKDEVVLEIETDKAAAEVTSDVEGVLLAVVVPAGQEAAVGATLAWIGRAGEVVPVAPAPAALAPSLTPAGLATGMAETMTTPAGRVRATPAARSRARAEGIALATVRGTGPDGRIQARDVKPAPPLRAALAPGAYEDLPVSGKRKVIAERLSQSFHRSVPVLLTTEVAMERASDLLAQLEADVRARTGAPLGYLPLIIKAAALALRAHPRLNAHWREESIRLFEEIAIGVAVALDDGLVVPVLRQAERLSLAEIAVGVAGLADRARHGSLLPQESEGGTFTISNLGAYHVGFFMPVINPPQIAILGAGRVGLRPGIRDGQVHAAPVLPLSLVFDHRAVDGAPAAAFLDAITAGLEEPYRLLV